MEEMQGYHDGDIETSKPLRVLGTIGGSLIARANSVISVDGTILQNLLVHPGAEATVNGTVLGVVENFGGKLRVFGTVKELMEHPGAVTTVGPKAEIGKRTHVA